MTSAFLPATPAEQTRMSIWSISPAAARVARSTAFGSVTLTSSERAELPPTSATAAFRRAGSWSQIVARPPSAAIRFAPPSPMPDAPPVTTAVIPSNRLASDTFKSPDAVLMQDASGLNRGGHREEAWGGESPPSLDGLWADAAIQGP